jgi:hypothetical protein
MTTEQSDESQEPQNEVMPAHVDYVLLKDINWFGKRTIKAGTIYKQVNGDYWHPTIEYARCPSLQLHFTTVLVNPEYFLKISK